MKLDQLKDLMKVYGMKPLAEKAGVSRASLYNLIHGENFESNTLERVTKVLNVEFGLIGKIPTYEDVCNHLAYYGAPLAFDKSMPVLMSLEESAKWGLQLSKRDGLLESVMPYFLLLNFNKMNRVKLFSYLDQKYLFQLLGYYTELANRYSENNNMKEFLSLLHQDGFPQLQLGTEKLTDRALNVLKSKSNFAAKKWNVLSYGSSDDYFERFRKWERRK